MEEAGISKLRKDTPARLPTSKILLCNQGITLSVDECEDDERATFEHLNDNGDDKKAPEVIETVIVPRRKTSFLVPREDREIRRNSVQFDESINVKETSANNTDSDSDTDDAVYNHLELKDGSDEDSDEGVQQLRLATTSLAMKVRKDSLKGRGRPPRFRWPGGDVPGTPPSTPVGTPYQDSNLTLRVLEKTKEKVQEKL